MCYNNQQKRREEMCETKYTQEEIDSFAQEAKIGYWSWGWVAGLLTVSSVMFVSVFVNLIRFDHTQTYRANFVAGTFFGMGIGGLCLVAMIAIFLGSVWGSRHRAIDQCRFVAEKYVINMSPKDAHHLAISLYAGSVFEQFYLLIKENRPELIPEGFLEGSGGENWTAYRRLVESLWNRYIEKTEKQLDATVTEGVCVSEAPAI